MRFAEMIQRGHNASMTPKKTLNLAVPSGLLDEFNTVCRQYGHAKQKGMVLSAAILMFLRADPKKQGECLHEVLAADIAMGVKKMLAQKVEAARQQADAAATPSRHESTTPPPMTAGKLTPPAPQRKAAKKAGKAVKGLTRLPRLDDLKRSD